LIEAVLSPAERAAEEEDDDVLEEEEDDEEESGSDKDMDEASAAAKAQAVAKMLKAPRGGAFPNDTACMAIVAGIVEHVV
jgi:hypothetical protein